MKNEWLNRIINRWENLEPFEELTRETYGLRIVESDEDGQYVDYIEEETNECAY